MNPTSIINISVLSKKVLVMKREGLYSDYLLQNFRVKYIESRKNICV